MNKILKLVVAVGSIIGIFTLGNVVAGAETSSSSSTEKVEIIEVVKNYISTDSKGNHKFDIKQAKKDQVEDAVLEIGYVVNSFGNSETSVKERALLIYGNYCGLGNNGTDIQPTDDLDEACMHHDSCYIHGGDNTECNAAFRKRLRVVMDNTPVLSYKYAVAAGAYLVFG
ncbi:MAG: phospholipase [Lactobacillales bacterium]|nr:phospholipase [Lactobacillales bacterium]